MSEGTKWHRKMLEAMAKGFPWEARPERGVWYLVNARRECLARFNLDSGHACRLAASAPRLQAALKRLIDRYDEETGTIDAGAEHYCQECTGGRTPNNFDKGPCPRHEALAILKELDE